MSAWLPTELSIKAKAHKFREIDPDRRGVASRFNGARCTFKGTRACIRIPNLLAIAHERTALHRRSDYLYCTRHILCHIIERLTELHAVKSALMYQMQCCDEREYVLYWMTWNIFLNVLELFLLNTMFCWMLCYIECYAILNAMSYQLLCHMEGYVTIELYRYISHTRNRCRLWDNRLYRVLTGIIGTADTNYEKKHFRE